jgi:hypothetical protein
VEVSQTQLEEWIEAVEELPSLVDGHWLEAEVSKVAAAIAADTSGGRRARSKRHPLAELTYQVRQELPNVRATGRGTVSLAKLGAIATSIRILRAANVAGLSDRVARLTSGDGDFESARFELEVAALHVVMNHEVRFLPESPGVQTADLEVDGSIEIECKHKVELSQRDLAMRDLWGLLERRLYDVLPDSGAFRVELWTHGAPTRSDVDWALDAVRSGLGTLGDSNEVTVSDAEAGRELRLFVLQVEERGTSIGGPDPPGALPMDAFDFGKMEVTANLIVGSSLRHRLVLQLLFRTDERQDWIAGVGTSVRKARSQLSGTRPGLVFVEVPAAIRSNKGPGLGPLGDVVGDAFRNSRRLSAVAIAITGWQEDGHGNGHAVAEYHVEQNPDARNPLPRGYYVSREKLEEWKRNTGRNEPCPCGSGKKFKQCCLP